MATVISGAEIAQQIKAEVRRDVQEHHRLCQVTPGLAVVLVGGDPASALYARKKEQACQEVGIFCQVFHLPQKTSQDELLELIQQLNGDARFHGILPQFPFPPHIDEAQVARALSPDKDVDCLHPFNIGLLAMGKPVFISAAALAVQQLLVRTDNDPAGRHVVVVCGGNVLLCNSMALLLAQERRGASATVTVCRADTADLADFTRTADILIAAIESPRAIKADMVKAGAIVIDASLIQVKDASRVRGYRVEGGVDSGPVSKVACAIAPSPGGVGPMTIAMLLANTAKAAQLITEENPQNEQKP